MAGAPGLISGSSAARASEGVDAWAVVSSYAPTLPEVVVAVGVFAFGILAFILLAKKFLRWAPEGDDAQAK